MSTRRSRPSGGRGGGRADHLHHIEPIDRPETLHQAERWDVMKSRALAFGMCDRCASQYSWGLSIGFTHSHSPCDRCAPIIASTAGEARPNGWRNLRLKNVASTDIRERPHAHRSRHTTPEKYREGYGMCQCGSSWTGYSTAHCAGCHCTFVDERTFARHRLRGRCQDPESRGLVKIQRAHWIGWGRPAQRDRLER